MGCQGTKPGLAICQVSTLPAVLLLWPCSKYIKAFDWGYSTAGLFPTDLTKPFVMRAHSYLSVFSDHGLLSTQEMQQGQWWQKHLTHEELDFELSVIFVHSEICLDPSLSPPLSLSLSLLLSLFLPLSPFPIPLSSSLSLSLPLSLSLSFALSRFPSPSLFLSFSLSLSLK